MNTNSHICYLYLPTNISIVKLCMFTEINVILCKIYILYIYK